MSTVLSSFAILFLSLVLSTTWLFIAVLSRMSEALFLPQAVRFGAGALVLLILSVVLVRHVPRISLRLFHAAISVAGLAYVLSPILCWYALQSISSGLGVLVYVSIPIWFLLAAYGEGTGRLPLHFALVLGLVLFTVGVVPVSQDRAGDAWYVHFIFLFLGMFAFMGGTWVSRRLFWLHTAIDLNFWSMLFAALVHFFFGVVNGEVAEAVQWDKIYWIYLGSFGVIVTGLGAYFYRVRLGQYGSLALTILVPIFALTWAVLLWEETPLNLWTVLGAGIVIALLAINSLYVRPAKWMCLYLSNDKRQGDRLLCTMQGKSNFDEQETDIQITDISMGGLGFRSSRSYESGDRVAVELPIGQRQNRLTLDCRVVHCHPNQGSRDFPFAGGMRFFSLSERRYQSMTEFLARLSDASED